MDLNAATRKVAEQMQAQAEAPKYSRISVEPIAEDGGPSRGYRVVGRDLLDYSKYHELAK